MTYLFKTFLSLFIRPADARAPFWFEGWPPLNVRLLAVGMKAANADAKKMRGRT